MVTDWPVSLDEVAFSTRRYTSVSWMDSTAQTARVSQTTDRLAGLTANGLGRRGGQMSFIYTAV